jgi:hypothetical protein
MVFASKVAIPATIRAFLSRRFGIVLASQKNAPEWILQGARANSDQQIRI